MRMLALLVCVVVAWAAAPLSGTWKLNREKSTLNGALPSFIHNDMMSFRPGGVAAPMVPSARFVAVDGAGENNIYHVDVSPDQRILTMTRVESYEDQSGKRFHTILVLEKQ